MFETKQNRHLKPKENLNLLLQAAKEEMSAIKKGLANTRELSSRVAAHFCESEASFKLEEFISIMKSFFEKIKQCEKVGFNVLT